MVIKKYLDYIISFALFVGMNIPSIKIIYSSEAVNILTLVSIWVFGLTRVMIFKKGKLLFSNTQNKFLFLFITLWLIMIANSLANSSIVNLSDFAQYSSVILIVIGATILFEYSDLHRIFFYQIVWGGLLSIGSLMGVIELDLSLGQHYLTLGLPLAAAIVVNVIDLISNFKHYKKVSVMTRILVLIVSIIAVSSLQGRSPVILSVLIPTFFILAIILREKNIASKLRSLFITIIIIISIIYIIVSNVSQYWIARFDGLANFTNEPRYYIYTKAIEIIKNNPLGRGLDDFSGLPGYPHNILLEVSIAGGLIATVIFILIVSMLIKSIWKSAVTKGDLLVISSLALYFLVVWNISFDLTASYVPFIAVGLAVNAEGKKNEREIM
ncbi:O-antigen ligase family protein [Aerococcus agrisoli]|uniref:O-antigen ligase family protein n=1 Tax=Aerococcus agrisoli TaxID=2487350 RepID=UPI001315973A|nr:O-antigen ligase family protein [Aerococcus agrisoli]